MRNQVLEKRVTNDLYLFYRYFVTRNFEGSVPAPHIKRLAQALTRVTFDTESKNRLCVSMPPQHSKSSLITIAYTVWLILQNPNRKILVINAEAGLSETFGIQIRDLMERLNGLKGITISNVKSSSTYIMFNKNGRLQQGHIRLVGSKGSITGHPEDIIIIDDPYKGIEDTTPTLLHKKIDWYTTIVEQRVRPKTKVIILHTRWHSNDLIGYLEREEPHKYDFITFPAIDENNNVLWPQYYDYDFYLDKQATLGERMFQALYQQKPLDLTSNFFYTDNIIWDEYPDTHYHIASCRSWDLAYTEASNPNSKNADYTAGVNAYKIDENNYLFTDFVHGQYGKENIRRIQNTAYLDGPNKTILIETGTKGAAAKELFNVWKNDYLARYNCKQSEPWGTKADRAQALADAMYDGKIHFSIIDNDLRRTVIEQFSAFPQGDHDDIVDACTYAFLYLRDKGASQIVTGGQRRSSTRRRRRI